MIYCINAIPLRPSNSKSLEGLAYHCRRLCYSLHCERYETVADTKTEKAKVRPSPTHNLVCLNSYQVLEGIKLSHIMRKPVFAICKQQKHRSACVSARSDQRLCYSLLR